MTIKCAQEAKTKKKEYVPHKLRSRPFRCISLPICCLFLFIFYWFAICPPLYYVIDTNYKLHHKNDWIDLWPYYFWSVALFVFILLLSMLVCLWCCKRKDETNEGIKARQKEFDSLLSEAIEYNTLRPTKQETFYNISLKSSRIDVDVKECESKTASKETLDDKNFCAVNLQDLKMGETQSVLTEVPLKEITSCKNENEQEQKETAKTNNDDSLMKDIDRLFPRCSVKRKVDVKRRPDTLILNSPTVKEPDFRRHTMKDVHSPLTPREIFFRDLIESANKHTSSTCLNFIDNERKHSSDDFAGLRKPKIKDFVWKKGRSDGEASSPEYFIANVSNRRSCTSEAFLFVDGGSAESKFKVTDVETDDVFEK